MSQASSSWGDRVGRRLKLRDLHILSTVIEWGSMAKGARYLGMSQPAVSEAIASLEDVLRVRLLDRSPRGVEPTIYARALLKHGHIAFDELREGIKEIEFLSDPSVGEVRVGCPESMTAGFLSAVVDQFSRQHPGVVVRVVNAQTAEQEFRELRERSVDLMIGRVHRPLSAEEVTVEMLCRDEFFVVAGAQNRWVRREKIAFAELMDEPWILFPPGSLIMSYVEKAFRAQGLRLPRETVTSFSVHLRMQLLATGRFLTVLFGSVLHHNAKRWSLKPLPVDIGIPPVPIGIFTLKNRTLSPVVRLFVQQARVTASQFVTKAS
jgi:DNA-binding transcriptional LysR family regulator